MERYTYDCRFINAYERIERRFRDEKRKLPTKKEKIIYTRKLSIQNKQEEVVFRK